MIDNYFHYPNYLNLNDNCAICENPLRRDGEEDQPLVGHSGFSSGTFVKKIQTIITSFFKNTELFHIVHLSCVATEFSSGKDSCPTCSIKVRPIILPTPTPIIYLIYEKAKLLILGASMGFACGYLMRSEMISIVKFPFSYRANFLYALGVKKDWVLNIIDVYKTVHWFAILAIPELLHVSLIRIIPLELKNKAKTITESIEIGASLGAFLALCYLNKHIAQLYQPSSGIGKELFKVTFMTVNVMIQILGRSDVNGWNYRRSISFFILNETITRFLPITCSSEQEMTKLLPTINKIYSKIIYGAAIGGAIGSLG